MESLVSSLLGVTESRVEREASGAIRSLHASVAPGHSPDRVRREIRSALLSSLDLDLDPDVVDVQVEEQLGRRQEQFWEGPERTPVVDETPEVEAPGDAEQTREAEPDRETESQRAVEAPLGRATPADDAPEADETSEGSAGETDGEAGSPEEWLARADASPRSRERPTGGRPSSEDRPEEVTQRDSGGRRLRAERRSGEDRRDGTDRRSGSDRRRGRTSSAVGEASARDQVSREKVSGERLSREKPPIEEAEATPREWTAPSVREKVDEALRDDGSETERSPGAESTRPDDTATQAPEKPGSLLPLSLGEYILLGGGGKDVGVELRIRVETGGDRFVGTVRVSSLEDVSPGLFVGATLRAVEQALDARPVSERSARILILEAVDMEQVVLREGRFLAATVQAVHRDGESRATGLVPAEGRVLREAAAEAALDAVTRILQGRHTRRVEGRGRIRRPMGGPHASGSRDPSREREGEARAGGESGGSEGGGIGRDPFHVWE